MKSICKVLLTVLLGISPWFASAQFSEMALTGGIQTTEVDIDTTGSDPDGGTGFYAGILGFMEMGNNGFVRSGLLLSQRKFENGDLEAETLNLDVPITYLMMMNDLVGVFGGAKLGLNISDDCSAPAGITCETDAETIYFGLELGGHFRFAPNFGAEATFNMGLGEIAKNVDWENSLMAGVFYLF